MTDRLREALDERPPYVLRLTGEQIGSIQPTPEGDWFTDWDEYEDFVPRRMLDAAIDEAATYRRIAGANAALNEPAPALDVERLREAAQAAVFALDFHNKTPTGRRRSCDPKCIACAAIDALRAALGDEP